MVGTEASGRSVIVKLCCASRLDSQAGRKSSFAVCQWSADRLDNPSPGMSALFLPVIFQSTDLATFGFGQAQQRRLKAVDEAPMPLPEVPHAQTALARVPPPPTVFFDLTFNTASSQS